MELPDLNSDLNNSIESSSIKDILVEFLIDSLMCLNILFLALEILKSSSSGSILITLQLSSFF